MPEGPEIRLAADRVAKVLEGQDIEDIWFAFDHLAPFEAQLIGRRVETVGTRGKAMLTRFDCGLTLYTHNQLYGRWFTRRRPKRPSTNRSLRVAILTASHSALLYSASDIEVLDDDGIENHPFLRRLGPDILDAATTKEQIMERLLSPTFRNRSVAGLYLDQRFLAGNGNYLRSEILWAAKVAPARKPAELLPAAVESLARETLRVSRRSYKTRGVTATPALVASLREQGFGFRDYRHFVFGRSGQTCYRCGDIVTRVKISSRSVYWCSGCQN